MGLKIGTFNNTREWIDFSSLDMLMKCPRWYYWRAVCGITPSGVSSSLINGSAYHLAWAAYELAKMDKQPEQVCINAGLQALVKSDITKIKDDPYRNLTAATDTLLAYWERWKSENYTSIDVEVGFAVDLGGVVFIGKIDRVCESPLGLMVMEHKTTSIIGNKWDKRGRPNLQIDGYVSAYSILTGKKLYGAVLDVCPVPYRKALKSGEKKQEAFRIITSRNAEDIDCWIANVNEWWITLQRYRTDHTWPMNTERCYPMTGYDCPYPSLCSMFPHPTQVPKEFTIPSEFIVEHWAPFDLEGGNAVAEVI